MATGGPQQTQPVSHAHLQALQQRAKLAAQPPRPKLPPAPPVDPYAHLSQEPATQLVVEHVIASYGVREEGTLILDKRMFSVTVTVKDAEGKRTRQVVALQATMDYDDYTPLHADARREVRRKKVGSGLDRQLA